MATAQVLVDAIKASVKIDALAEAELLRLAKVEKLAKGTELIGPGKIASRMYLVHSGALRTYFFQEGKDITHWIYTPGTQVSSWMSYYAQVPADDYIEVTDDAVLISISYKEWEMLYEKYPELERYTRHVAEAQIAMIDGFFKGYYFLPAKQKYENLLMLMPDVTQKANLGHIASMLGISQETLSRIRAKY